MIWRFIFIFISTCYWEQQQVIKDRFPMGLMRILSPVLGSRPYSPSSFLSFFTPLLLLQLHDHTEPLLPLVYGAGLDLLCVHDREEHCAGEGAAPQGDSQGHGGRQRSHLVHVFHRQLHHDDREHGAAHLHHHGEEAGGSRIEKEAELIEKLGSRFSCWFGGLMFCSV